MNSVRIATATFQDALFVTETGITTIQLTTEVKRAVPVTTSSFALLKRTMVSHTCTYNTSNLACAYLILVTEKENQGSCLD